MRDCPLPAFGQTPCSFSGPQFPHLMVLGWLIPRGRPRHLCPEILWLLVGGVLLKHTPTRDGKKVKLKEKGSLLFLLGPWTRRRDSLRTLFLGSCLSPTPILCFASHLPAWVGKRAGDGDHGPSLIHPDCFSSCCSLSSQL